MNESNPPTKVRKTVKQKLADTISKRINVLEKRLEQYSPLVQELSEYKQMLSTLNGDKKTVVETQTTKVETGSRDPVDYFNNDDPTPLSEEGRTILDRVGLTGMSFTTTDLMPYLDNNKQKAYQWIARWKEKGLIRTIAFGQYQKT